jgi:uncharacterized membrane protein YoaK (UPF0700 family)
MRLQVKSGIGTFLLMSFTVGYCDSITFFTSGFFSGHILGNIIFSAYQLLHHNTAQGTVLLLSLPVYLTGMFIAGRVLKFTSITTNLFKTAGIMLMVTGLLSAVLIVVDVLNSQAVYFLIAFLIVVAMSITGATRPGLEGATNLINSFIPGFWVQSKSLDNRDSLFVLTCFIIGCASGAIAGNFVGLSGVMLPGVLLFLFTLND